MAFNYKTFGEASCSQTQKRFKTEESEFMILKCETDESNLSEDDTSSDMSLCLNHQQGNAISMFAQREQMDIGQLLSKPRNMITNHEKLVMLSEQWLIPPNFFFPMREIRGKPRKFCPRWLVEYPWMRYSVSRDAVWCVYCALFGNKKKFLATDPVRDWANIGTFVKRHISDISGSHDTAVQRGNQFLLMMKGEGVFHDLDDDSSPSSIMNDPFCLPTPHVQEHSLLSTMPGIKMDINSDLIKVVLRIIILCVKGSISLHQIPNLMNFQAATDPVLASNMACSGNLPLYFSYQMHQDLINYCAKIIRKKIVGSCNSAPYFSVIMHSTEECSENPKHLLCVRYIDRQGHIIVREEFLDFVDETNGMTEIQLADAVISKLQDCGIDLKRMKGQGHTSSFKKGQDYHSQIKVHCPNALHSHCCCNNLNQSILQSCKNVQFKHLLATLRRLKHFLKENREKFQTLSNPQNEGMNVLLDLEWMDKSDFLSVCVNKFTTIVSALERLKDMEKVEANNLRCSFVSFDTILTLVTGYRLLEYIVPLSESLQSVTSDLPSAAEEAVMLVDLFRRKKHDERLFHSIFEEAVKLGTDLGLQAVVPTSAKIQADEKDHEICPSHYWKTALFLPLLDHIGHELTDKLIESKERFTAQYLIPSRIHKLTQKHETSVFDPFSSDILRNTHSYQLTELDRWRHRWAEAPDKPSTFREAFEAAHPDLYPNIATALAVLLSMPVSSQTGEVSASVIPQVESYLESHKLDVDHQAGLVLMHVHPDLLTEAVCEETVSQFVVDASRKMPLPVPDQLP